MFTFATAFRESDFAISEKSSKLIIENFTTGFKNLHCYPVLKIKFFENIGRGKEMTTSQFLVNLE